MGYSEGIRVYEGNPRYWQVRGKPALLLGGTDDDNVFNWPDREQVRAHLELLAGVGGNYDRCVMSARDEGNVKPYALLSNGQYDLRQWNPAFWERFEFYLQTCHRLGIIVQVDRIVCAGGGHVHLVGAIGLGRPSNMARGASSGGKAMADFCRPSSDNVNAALSPG